jgi:hypothetical protein
MLVCWCILQNDLFNIYKGANRSISKACDEVNNPGHTNPGHNEATKALKSSEELTFTDKEIDIFLPKELRKTI